MSDFDAMLAATHVRQAELRTAPRSELLASFYASCAVRGFDPNAMTRNWSDAERAVKQPHRDRDAETERVEGWDYQERRDEE